MAYPHRVERVRRTKLWCRARCSSGRGWRWTRWRAPRLEHSGHGISAAGAEAQSWRTLTRRTGASETVLDMSRTNPVAMDRASLAVGAADFTARRLGNLNARRIEMSAGVGDVTIDLTGNWQQDAVVRVKMGLGALELRFPEGLGVRMERHTFLTSLDPERDGKAGRRLLFPQLGARHPPHHGGGRGGVRQRRRPLDALNLSAHRSVVVHDGTGVVPLSVDAQYGPGGAVRRSRCWVL